MEGLYVAGLMHCAKTRKKLKLPEFVQQREDSFFPEFIRWLGPRITTETKDDIGLSDGNLHESGESTGERPTWLYFQI